MASGAEATLYVIRGSHACRTGMLLLEHKGISYRTVTLPAGTHSLAVRLLGFPGSGAEREIDGATPALLASLNRLGTVPALRLDGRRVQTSRGIARFLERHRPDPPLFPADPARRQAAEEAERWGDESLQMLSRRLILATSARSPSALAGRGSDGRLGPLLSRSDAYRRISAQVGARVIFRAEPDRERELLAQVPQALDRVDEWIAAGVLDGEELGAADYAIAPSLALMEYREDVREQLNARPAVALLERVLPRG